LLYCLQHLRQNTNYRKKMSQSRMILIDPVSLHMTANQRLFNTFKILEAELISCALENYVLCKNILFLSGYKRMKIISQEICTVHSSMSIKNSKICNFFPLSTILWSGNIQNNSDTILIVIPDRPLISGC